MPQKLSPETVWSAVKTARSTAAGGGWIAVGGAPQLAEVLARELGRDAAPGAVRVATRADGATVLVYVLTGPATEEDRNALRASTLAHVPAVAVLADASLEMRVPHVPATNLVRVPAGRGFPVDQIATVIAQALGDDGASLAARVPVVRAAVCEALITAYARRAGLIGVAVFLRGADMPALTLNQIRLVLLLGVAHGIDVDRERLPEVLAVVGSGIAFRTAARRLLVSVPRASWLVKGAFAYGGTRAIGEAAVRYFEVRAGSERPARSRTR